jgi:hypothetical protein
MLLKQSARLEAILEELDKARLKFLHLLDEVSEKDWNRRFPGEGWTIKQEMVHIVQVLNVIPDGIRRASTGRVRSFLAFVPAGLRSWVNGHVVIPMMAINATHASLANNYNKAHTTLVDLLVTLPEEAWSKGMPYPKKYRTVEQMAHRPVEHFEEHLGHLRNMRGTKHENC